MFGRLERCILWITFFMVVVMATVVGGSLPHQVRHTKVQNAINVEQDVQIMELQQRVNPQ